MPPSTPDRAVAWQRLDMPGLEHCLLRRDAAGVMLDGALVVVLARRPVRVAYTVRCSSAWETERVEVRVLDGATPRTLALTVDAARRWWQDGRELPAVAGCVDVDLGVTPSTNTLPIRRLGLAAGARAAVTAAWVRFPELTVEPLAQTYARTGADAYRYESAGGAFTADLTVDDVGLVVDYPPLWARVAAAGNAPQDAKRAAP